MFAASLSKRAATEVAIGAVEDWVEALAAEHRNIEGLFEQILSAGETETLKRAKLFRRLDRVMSRHAFAEEQVVYTTLGQHEADAEARQLSADHFDHRAMLHALDALDLESPFDLLGLFQGIGLGQGPAVAGTGQLPNAIWLYRRPILDYWAEHDEALGTIITHVLIHEIGHHFGLSDEDIEAIEASVA